MSRWAGRGLRGALLVTVVAVPCAAQSARRLPLLPESRVWVEGTSNKNDWSVEAKQLSGYVVLSLAGATLEVREGSFTVASASMKSEHGVIMDRLMHNALEASEYSDIVYQLTGASAAAQPDGRFALATHGRLALVGVTKELEQVVTAERAADGRVRFTGSYPIDMVEWGIKPPTAMFGSLRTGRRVVVRFDLLVKP